MTKRYKTYAITAKY